MIYVAITIGVPAAGKSSLAREILNISKSGLLPASVIVLSFDDCIQLNFGDIMIGDYKQKRAILISSVEKLLANLRNQPESEWLEVLSSSQLPVKFNLVTPPLLLILDDNFYYHSMRQRIRAICRQQQCGFFQILMKSSLEEAKLRNAQRAQPIPDAVICRMFNNFEEPTNSRTIILRLDAIDHCSLASEINDCLENPESLVEEVEPEQQQQQSLIHEMDLITRKQLSIKIRKLKESRDRDDLPEASKMLNQKRLNFLDDLRARRLDTADIQSLIAAFNCYLDER